MQTKYAFILAIILGNSFEVQTLSYPEINQTHIEFCNQVQVAYHSEIEANGGNCIIDSDFQKNTCDKLRRFRPGFQDEQLFAQSVAFLLTLCPGQRFKLTTTELAQYFRAIENLTPIFYHTPNPDGRQTTEFFISLSLLKASYELFLFRRTCNDQTVFTNPSGNQIHLHCRRKSAVSSLLRFARIISNLLASHGAAQEFITKTKVIGSEFQLGLTAMFHGHHLLDYTDGLLRAVHACAVAMDYDRGGEPIGNLFETLSKIFS